MQMNAAKAHIEEAYQLMTGEAYRIAAVDVGHKEPEPILDFCTMVIELERVDCALGPKGESMFGRMADQLRAVYTEIIAARKLMKGPTP